jgi:hypothetical protein
VGNVPTVKVTFAGHFPFRQVILKRFARLHLKAALAFPQESLAEEAVIMCFTPSG